MLIVHSRIGMPLEGEGEDSKLDWTDDKDEPEEETARNKDIETEAKRETQQ